MIISIHVPLNIYRMGWILLLIIPDHIEETRKFNFQPWINSVTTLIRSRLISITVSAGGRGGMLQKWKSIGFLPDQNFVIDPFLCSGDRMTEMWRAYQSLMSRYPWTVQIVTAGRKKALYCTSVNLWTSSIYQKWELWPKEPSLFVNSISLNSHLRNVRNSSWFTG